MDIEKELKYIAEKKKGDKEMAFSCNSFRDGWEDKKWYFELGNSYSMFMNLGGENEGELETSGDSLEEVINKMKYKVEHEHIQDTD